MTIEMFEPTFRIRPYSFSSRCVSVLDSLSISNQNTHRVWCEAALDEFKHRGYWYLLLYSLDPKAWTLFYWRKNIHPDQRMLFPGARQIAFEAGLCGRPSELHFFDLDIGRPTVDYGHSMLNEKNILSAYRN